MAGNVRGEVARREGGTGVARTTPREALRQLLDQNRDAVTLSLPRGFNEDRFIRLLLTAANTSPKLFDCDPMSFLAAGVQCAQLGLEPNDARGLAYLVPFWDGHAKKFKVQPIIGYRGYIDLATRSGVVSGLYAQAVFADDEFTYHNDERGRHFRHVPNPRGAEDPATITHVVAAALVAGEPRAVVVTRGKIEEAKAASQTGSKGQGPWADHFQEMAEKTGIRRLAKWLPLTVEAARAVDVDERPLVLGDISMVDPGDRLGVEPEDEGRALVGDDEPVDTTATEKESTDG